MTRTQALDLYIGATLILALSTLTERQRHILTATEWRNLTQSQIARETGLTRQRVGNILETARTNLHTTLQPYQTLLLENIT